MFTTFRIRLPVWPVQAPDRTRSLKWPSCQDRMDPGDHVLAVDLDDRPLRCAERDVQDGAVLGDVDLLAAEHRRDPIAQRARSASAEQAERLVGDPVLRVVEEQAGGLGGHPLAAPWIGGEQLPQVGVAQLRGVPLAGRPLGCLVDPVHRAASMP